MLFKMKVFINELIIRPKLYENFISLKYQLVNNLVNIFENSIELIEYEI